MDKKEIAKLVQQERQKQFARYSQRELAAVAAVNTGQHGALREPLEVPTHEEMFKAFTGRATSDVQSVSYWEQFFSGHRLSLDESAGLLMALDNSQVKFAAHVLARKIPAKQWPPFGLAPQLVTAFADMRARLKAWRVDSDGKYEADDLIDWAKGKGLVADEVLEAWEAHGKANDLIDGAKEKESLADDLRQVEVQTVQPPSGNEPTLGRDIANGLKPVETEKGDKPTQDGPKADAVENRESLQRHTTKDARRDILTPVIEHAQSLCKNKWDVAEVWGQLDTLTAQKYLVLSHWEGKAISYRDGDEDKLLNRKKLSDRLRRMRDKSR